MSKVANKTRYSKNFLEAKYWPQLDGLRTLSFLVVLVSHMGDENVWGDFDGTRGVNIFFVLSGFLITSLLIREERKYGRVSLKGFYIRRLFRIAPLYYLMMAVTLASVAVGLGQGGPNLLQRLLLIGTFNGEFAGEGIMYVTWSLGIEEKFYLLWPLLAFFIPFTKKYRFPLAFGLLFVFASLPYLRAPWFLGVYTGILAGVCVALLLHSRFAERIFSVAVRPWAVWGALVLAVVLFVLDKNNFHDGQFGWAHVPLSFGMALLFPAFILGVSPLAKILAWKPLVHIGTRVYAMYLFHRLMVNVVDKIIAPSSGQFSHALPRIVLTAVLTFALAEVLARVVEGPMIAVGRRLADKAAPRVAADAIPASAEAPAPAATVAREPEAAPGVPALTEPAAQSADEAAVPAADAPSSDAPTTAVPAADAPTSPARGEAQPSQKTTKPKPRRAY